MNVHARLQVLQRRVRRRRIALVLLQWLPWIALAGIAAWRLAGPVAGAGLTLAVSAVMAWHALRRAGRIDSRWLIRRLDAQQRELQDSSDLLFAGADTLGPLQQLQQARMQQRFASTDAAELREPFATGRLLRNAIAAGLLLLLVWIWPSLSPARVAAPAVSATDATIEATSQSVQAQLDITPPAYTGGAASRVVGLDADIVEGSAVAWTLQFTSPATAVRVRFLDGETLALSEDAGRWHGQRRIDASVLYRIEVEPVALPEASAARLQVRPDRAPQVSVITPERTLTVLEGATRQWPLVFDASDDYGLGRAELRLTLAQGSGEQVSVSERRVVLRGNGDARRQHFEHRIDLAAFGFARGDDLIARIEVRDQREPEANVSRSASFILRWPPEPSSDGSGVEGLVQKALPAYFRSQRQIIIDTEALLEQHASLDRDSFVVRSDTIGVDQRLLRLRYGQFLGEESEDAASAGAHDHDHENETDSGHDDTDVATPSRFGDADELIAQAGHLHDIPEAATLLDPQTRSLLRAALNEMWQAELQLRTGEPRRALPYEQRALDYIKRVQQSSRIYLARVGLELPQLDPTRRLSGEPAARGSRSDPLQSATEEDTPMLAWQALQHGTQLPLAALLIWIRDPDNAVEEPLALMAEIDALERADDCGDCRERLAARLWPLLTPAAAAPAIRPRHDGMGRAYLDALTPDAGEP